MSGYAISYWPGTNLVRGGRAVESEADCLPDETYWPNSSGPPPEAVPSPAQQEAAQYTLLDSKQRQAILQISAIQSRIDAIDYLINGQDPEDPDYMEPTPAEIAEVPVRKAQLKTWNTYRAKLGRVVTAAGWWETPTWPVTPEPYTSEISKTSDAS